MSESETVRLVRAARVEILAPVAETIRQAGALGDGFGAEYLGGTARQAVAAWAMAVEGDDTALAAADPDAAYWLMHPDQGRWQVAAGPRVTQIQVRGLEPDQAPPRLRVYFEFAGGRRPADPAQAENADGDRAFAGLLTLALTGPGSWRLESGHVTTLDKFLGYVFTSRRETAEDYRRRTGSPVPQAMAPVGDQAAAGPVRRYRVIAGFAEHDERFGSDAEVEVQRAAEPTRYEAVELVWPAVEEETRRALGNGDWRPSLLWVDVIELLDGSAGG
jgi:hypothetical protein